MKGKTLRLYLVDGVPTGILTAEIINWTGKVIVGPRSQLSELAKRDEVKRTGIYCLVGPDPDHPEVDKVYIGEADNVLKRLLTHAKDVSKDFWTRTAVVISKDDNITKSHGRYLESRCIDMAVVAGRSTLANGSNPDPPALPEPDVADMEYFLEQVQLVFPVLGMNFLQPQPTYERIESEDDGPSPRFVMNYVGTKAYAIEEAGEFVVLKSSTARKQGVDSWTSYRKLRDDLISEGKLVDSADPEYFEFVENVAFSSPSAASSVVGARNSNGRLDWRLESNGMTYADWQEEKLAGADTDEDQSE